MSVAEPAPIAGLSWRALQTADAPALHALLRVVEVADDQPYVTTLHEVEQQVADPNVDLASDTLAGWAADGSLICFGAARGRKQALRRRYVWLDGHVHPDWRRRGVGSAVLGWTEDRGRQRLAAAPSDVPAFLEAWAEERLLDRRALFEKHGLAPIRWYIEMRRPLDELLPVRELPTDLELVPWSAEHDDAFREAHNTAFQDHWGSEPQTAEEWRFHYSESPLFRGDLSLALTAEGRIVSYVMAYHSESDSQATGRREGWLGQVGTLREWRGRGVASALMVRVMDEMQRAGMTHATLDVDSENPSGAMGLYERLGFAPTRRFVRWAKQV